MQMTTGAAATTQGDTTGGTPAGNTNTAGTGATGTGAPAAPAWLPGASPEMTALVTTKGWSGPDAVLQSYVHLEKLFGADKAGRVVEIPGEGADPKTLDGFYNRLGRPETVEKYSSKAKDFVGMPESTANDLLTLTHKLGLSDKQVAGLKEWNATSSAKLTEALTQNALVQKAGQETALKTEWGAAYDKNIQIGKEATAKLGWTKEQVDAMQIGLGFDGVMKLAHQLGMQVGEGKFIEGSGGRQGAADGTLTPQEAQTALSKLTSDKDFMKAWQDKADPGHAAALAKKSQLSAWAYPAK